MNEEQNTTVTLEDAASAYHAAEGQHLAATAALQAAQVAMTETRPAYFAAIAEELAQGVSHNKICQRVEAACSRKRTTVQRDIARVVIMTATGWDDAQTVSETPNIGQAKGVQCREAREAVEAAPGKREARAAVRALFNPAPVDEPADEPADEGDEEGSEGVDHGTQPGPDSVNIHEDMTAQIVAYLESHEDLNDGVKNLTARAREAYATLGITVKV
jgi:hypothetical protein